MHAIRNSNVQLPGGSSCHSLAHAMPMAILDSVLNGVIDPRHVETVKRVAASHMTTASSALDPLELAARSSLAGLLALARPRVSRHESRLLQRRAERAVEPLQRRRDAVAHGLRLAVDAAALDGRHHAVHARRVRLEEGRQHRVPLLPVPTKRGHRTPPPQH